MPPLSVKALQLLPLTLGAAEPLVRARGKVHPALRAAPHLHPAARTDQVIVLTLEDGAAGDLKADGAFKFLLQSLNLPFHELIG